MRATKAVTVWLTGLSGAGKTTLASALCAHWQAVGVPGQLLDGDVLRRTLSADLGFSPADRAEHLRRVAQASLALNQQGVHTVVALISPYRADRQLARALIGAERFLEVHIATPLAVCEARDVKGLYRQARAGSLPAFTGISAPYEAPLAPALVLDTSTLSLAAALQPLLALWAESQA